MPNKKISELTAATAIGLTDLLPIVQGGVTKKITWDEILKSGLPGPITIRGSDTAANIEALTTMAAGDMWIVTAPGTIDGIDYTAGDFAVYSGTAWLRIDNDADQKITGPASAISGNLAAYNGTTGKVAQDSGVAPSTDGTFAANSDAKVPTEKAIKTYTGLMFPRQRFFIAHRSALQNNTTGAISMTVDATARTITRNDGGNFLTQGFAAGISVTTTNFTNAGNNATFTPTAVTATVITVPAGPALVNETDASSTATAAFAAGGPVVLNTAQYDYSDGLITLDTTTGIFTLAAGHIYKFEGLFGSADFSSSSGFLSVCMRNRTDSVYFGYCSLLRPYTDTTNRDVLTKMFGIIDCTAGAKEVIPLITQVSVITSIGGGTPSAASGNGTANVLTIEVIR